MYSYRLFLSSSCAPGSKRGFVSGICFASSNILPSRTINSFRSSSGNCGDYYRFSSKSLRRQRQCVNGFDFQTFNSNISYDAAKHLDGLEISFSNAQDYRRSFSSSIHMVGSSSKDGMRYHGSLASAEELISSDSDSDSDSMKAANTPNFYHPSHTKEVKRLNRIRNVGIFAHVDAGKTTVTERMLALAGVVRQAGSVDDGNTVTDYLPAERERGITIQCAAISFPWSWHNNNEKSDNIVEASLKNSEQDNNVSISLIDTPGHVDFTVEVNRSVAVLDGAVLVIDSVAGVQAQTETVWKAMTNPSIVNNHVRHHETAAADTNDAGKNQSNNSNQITQSHHHEPLPCLVVVNKMDKDGCHYYHAIQSVRRKLPGANPLPIQLPLFQRQSSNGISNIKSTLSLKDVVALPMAGADDDEDTCSSLAEGISYQEVGDFVGVVDIVHKRAVIWPNHDNANIPEHCIPQIIPLLSQEDMADCQVSRFAFDGRWKLVEALAECGDRTMEEYYLQEIHPSDAELRAAIRRVTLSHSAIPVLAAAALRGKGIEPVLDAMADYLPSPLDREPPTLTRITQQRRQQQKQPRNTNVNQLKSGSTSSESANMPLGHSLNPTLLAFAFKVLHMKGRGGSGDGRVVFARVYSGTLRDRDVVQVISPSITGDVADISTLTRKERIGGMLELAGGRFSNIVGGDCRSGGVCALVGLKSVVTGDTIVIYPDSKKNDGEKKKKNDSNIEKELICLAGVAAPKPVLKVRLEAESTKEQTRLSEALTLLAVEDPSLTVEESESSTILGGLGELHIEVTLDRLKREHGLNVFVGSPSVAYRETISDTIETDGLHMFERSAGGTRLQASIHLRLEPAWIAVDENDGPSCMVLSEPTVSVSDVAKEYMNIDVDTADEDLIEKSELFRALVQGCKGALMRGPVKAQPMSNIHCHIIAVEADNGLPGLLALPGSLRAAAIDAISKLLSKHRGTVCTTLEPKMTIEITLPNEIVGTVLSDLTNRRGTINEVVVGEVKRGKGQAKSLILGDVPLVEILGYANTLRSITAGEAAFTAEYKGHSPSSN